MPCDSTNDITLLIDDGDTLPVDRICELLNNISFSPPEFGDSPIFSRPLNVDAIVLNIDAVVIAGIFPTGLGAIALCRSGISYI